MRASNGEIIIHEILEEHNVPFSEEQEFPGLTTTKGVPLRFDFCVFNDDGSVDFLIEYQGRQHYEPITKFGGAKGFRKQQYNDAQKRQFCLRTGLKLVCIPYWDERKLTYDYIMEAAGY